MQAVRRAGVASLLCAWLSLLGTSVRAEDPAPPRSSVSSLEIRYFDVGDLTAGITEFRLERMGELLTPAAMKDLDNPVFGSEGKETTKPLGGVDKLIELLKAEAAEPKAWMREGVSIAAMGDRTIVLRAPRTMIAALDAVLLDLARKSGTTVTVDVAALSGEPSAMSDADVAAAVARGALVPLGAARACGRVHQRIVGRQGGQFTYLAALEAKGTEPAQRGDPVVGVLSDGLGFDAVIASVSEERILLDVRATWSRRLARATHDAKDVGAIEVPALETCSATALVDAKPGVWTALLSSGSDSHGVVLAVRATLRPYDVKAREPIAFVDTTPSPITRPDSPIGPVVVRLHPVLDFCTKVGSRRGRPVDVWASGFASPEPPELAEAREVFPPENLVSFLKDTVDPASWGLEAASLDLKAGVLIAHTAAEEQDALDRMLMALRARFLQPTRVRAVVLTMPLSSLPEYWTGLVDAASLFSDGGAALVARAGAKVVDRASLALARNQRNASVSGRLHDYVGDFDVKLSKGAPVAVARIAQSFEGTSFDVDATPTGRGAGLVVEIRLDRSSSREARSVPTPCGEIECPSQHVLRMHGSTVLPLGATRVISANLDGPDATLVLVNASDD